LRWRLITMEAAISFARWLHCPLPGPTAAIKDNRVVTATLQTMGVQTDAAQATEASMRGLIVTVHQACCS